MSDGSANVVRIGRDHRRDAASGWYNLVLGVALALLTRYNKDVDPGLHFPAATVFFALFIAVIAYTSFLGWTGRHVGGDDDHDIALERAGAKVSLVFLALLAITLVAYWLTDLVLLLLRGLRAGQLRAAARPGIDPSISVHPLRVQADVAEPDLPVPPHHAAAELTDRAVRSRASPSPLRGADRSGPGPDPSCRDRGS